MTGHATTESAGDKVEQDLAEMDQSGWLYARTIAYFGTYHAELDYDLVGNYRVLYWGDRSGLLEERYTIEKYVVDDKVPGRLYWKQVSHAEYQDTAITLLRMNVELDTQLALYNYPK
jgi:hypothetical protein